jgi:hypothetical protein
VPRPMQEIKIYGVQDRRSTAQARLPWVVRYAIDGRHRSKSFRTRAEAERYRSLLLHTPPGILWVIAHRNPQNQCRRGDMHHNPTPMTRPRLWFPSRGHRCSSRPTSAARRAMRLGWRSVTSPMTAQVDSAGPPLRTPAMRGFSGQPRTFCAPQHDRSALGGHDRPPRRRDTDGAAMAARLMSATVRAGTTLGMVRGIADSSDGRVPKTRREAVARHGSVRR